MGTIRHYRSLHLQQQKHVRIYEVLLEEHLLESCLGVIMYSLGIGIAKMHLHSELKIAETAGYLAAELIVAGRVVSPSHERL